MKTFEQEEMIIVSKCLLRQITEMLDREGTKIGGELRSKLGAAESNLFKIIQLLETQAG